MTLVEALRKRTGYADRITNEEMLKRTESSFVRVLAELDVAAFDFCSVAGPAAEQATSNIVRALEHLSDRISKIESERGNDRWRAMGSDL